MDKYYVRIYHMKDGARIIPRIKYARYVDAVGELKKYEVDEGPLFTKEDVAYMTIEERYTFENIWNDTPLQD